jgi:hypothetical protein
MGMEEQMQGVMEQQQQMMSDQAEQPNLSDMATQSAPQDVTQIA